MRADLLARIPATGAYPLVLVHDPDGLLDPPARQALAERGCRLLEAAQDPLTLWAEAQAMRPWMAEAPLVLISERPLEQLPYDLWAQGHRVTFSLYEVAPDLALPCLRELTLEQRERLGELRPGVTQWQPAARGATARALLSLLFDAEPARLAQPGELVLWLGRAHSELGPLPPCVQAEVLRALAPLPGYAGWPLAALLGDVSAYRGFMQSAWDSYLSAGSGGYGALFAERSVQDGAGAMVRRGHLRPGVLPAGAAYRTGGAGPWATLMARAGGAQRAFADAPAELEALRAAVEERLAGTPDWEGWCDIAWLWARAAVLWQGGLKLPALVAERYTCVRDALDSAWATWLGAQYVPLAGQRLPTPHQVHHVAHWLARRRRRTPGARVALLVLDGCSLADWAMIGPAWQDRHPAWRLTQEAVLAQIPTVTSVSRQALVSGLRPDQMGDTLTSSSAEPRRWEAYWAGQGVAASGASTLHLALDREPEPEISSPRTVALCLVDSSIDELVHGASLGAAQVQDTLLRWLHDYSPRLESLIDRLLAEGYSVHLASDHGHVQATGIGRPAGGALSETRGQRARLYADRGLAEQARAAVNGVLWGPNALLPEDFWALEPRGREAYTTEGEIIVTHGGTTIEETMVPLITIESEDACR